MTSTSTFSGDSSSKPSSRVLRPPGGGSSIVFGGDPDTSSYKRNESAVVKQMEPKAELHKPSAEAPMCIGGVCQLRGQPRRFEPSAGPLHEPASAPAAAPATLPASNARGAKTCGYNLITGEEYPSSTATVASAAPAGQQVTSSTSVRQPVEAPAAGQQKVTSSISVRQPPGGVSTRPW